MAFVYRKLYDSIKKNMPFLINKMKNEVKEKKKYNVGASMKSAVNLMFIRMKATRGLNLF